MSTLSLTDGSGATALPVDTDDYFTAKVFMCWSKGDGPGETLVFGGCCADVSVLLEWGGTWWFG